MAGIPQSERDALVDRNFGVTPAANRYLALVTAAGSDTAAGTEVAAGDYARQAIAFTASDAGYTESTALVAFTAASAWGTIVGIEIYTALTSGTRVHFDGLGAADTDTKVMNDTDTLEFAAGSINYTFSA